MRNPPRALRGRAPDRLWAAFVAGVMLVTGWWRQ
jgi:hypothetical protein